MTYTEKPIVLVHDPRDELFPGVLHPDAALFSDYLDVRKANREHKKFRNLLTKCGMNVHTVRELLLDGTVDAKGEALAGQALEELKAFAGGLLEYEGDGTVDEKAQQRYKIELIRKAHPIDLVKIIFNRPKILLHATNDNTGFSADYIMRPMMNLLFMRDQMIVTRKGVIIGQLHSPQRFGESLVADFCLKKLGIKPIMTVRGKDAFLEGGDYVLWGDISFIGCGMRTTPNTIDMLMKADAFGTSRVVVVTDSLFSQEQMHLDTYFNIIDDNLATLSHNRHKASIGEAAHLIADVYERDGKDYQLIGREIPFIEYLSCNGFTVIPVSDEDSRSFGCNFLSIAPREIIAVSGKTAEYKATMRKYGVKTHWADLTHCTKGYGAAHCLTQVIEKV